MLGRWAGRCHEQSWAGEESERQSSASCHGILLGVVLPFALLAVLKFDGATESSGGFDKTQMAGSHAQSF